MSISGSKDPRKVLLTLGNLVGGKGHAGGDKGEKGGDLEGLHGVLER